ncbi:MAG: PEP-CTERM sorting domain-containing protein, partial [Opitutales bacterium]|nr:PEP-CTERM sorting domain-containing protein [Opitutales bacterium]
RAAAVVPEPSAFAFIAGVLALAGAFALRRRIGRGS